MALSKAHRQIVERAKSDPVFRLELLKELLRTAVKEDPELLEKTVAKLDAKKAKKR